MLVFDLADMDGVARKLDDLQVQYLKTLLYETVNGAVQEVHRNCICIPRPDGVLLLLGSPVEDRKVVAKHILRRCGGAPEKPACARGLGEPRESPDQITRTCREAYSPCASGNACKVQET